MNRDQSNSLACPEIGFARNAKMVERLYDVYGFCRFKVSPKRECSLLNVTFDNKAFVFEMAGQSNFFAIRVHSVEPIDFYFKFFS